MKITNKALGESYFIEKLENGLTVLIYPKAGFYKTYCTFTTNFGSLDTSFIPINSKEVIKTPEGIAHFLEHKLFEKDNGEDVSSDFASLGADVNAFTTASQTSYVFTATSNVFENVELLLDFVQNPNFNMPSIEKERGIIEQELLMYLDQSQTVLYYGLLKQMYKNNSIRNEIGGTVESIKEIDDDLLYICYNTFYHPSNMTLSIVGDFDYSKMLEVIKKNQNKKTFQKIEKIERVYKTDELKINEKNGFCEMDEVIPKVCVGLKIPCIEMNSKELMRQAVALNILISLYFDESADVYEQLMNELIINNSFEYSIYFEESYRHVLFYLDSNTPEVFIERLTKILGEIKENVIDETMFKTTKKQFIARNISRLNYVEYIANLLVESNQLGLTLFEMFDETNNITIEDVEEVKKYFDVDMICSYCVYPKKQD